MELGLVVGNPDGLGGLVAAHGRRLGAHELIELSAHGIGERADARGVPLRASVVHVNNPFLTDKILTLQSTQSNVQSTIR